MSQTMAGERNDPKEVNHSLTDCEMKLQDQKAERSGGLEPYGLRVSTKTRKKMGGSLILPVYAGDRLKWSSFFKGAGFNFCH